MSTTAIPVALAAPYVKPGESVVVLMGDAFFYDDGESNEVARMISETPENGNATLGFNVPRDQVSHYGILDLDANNNFVRIVEKPATEQAPSAVSTASRIIGLFRFGRPRAGVPC